MEIKKGDRVQIKNGLEAGNRYGGVEFMFNMIQYCGQYTTVKGYNFNGYDLDIDDGKYTWSIEMLDIQGKEEEDLVNNPKHYNMGKYQVIEVIEDWDLGYHLGNAIKYIGRCEHKGNKVQDLEKAIWYIQREIENEREK